MCLLLREPAFSLKEMTFRQIWEEKFPPLYGLVHDEAHPCHNCNLVVLCGKCPGWSQMEKGRMDSRVEYVCEVGRRRAEKLGYDVGLAAVVRSRKGQSEALLAVTQS